TYTMNAVPNQDYTIHLSANQYLVGTDTSVTPINTIPPPGWETTGENGEDNTGNGDGTPDGILAVTVGIDDIDNQNFGIRTIYSCPQNLTYLLKPCAPGSGASSDDGVYVELDDYYETLDDGQIIITRKYELPTMIPVLLPSSFAEFVNAV